MVGVGGSIIDCDTYWCKVTTFHIYICSELEISSAVSVRCGVDHIRQIDKTFRSGDGVWMSLRAVCSGRHSPDICPVGSVGEVSMRMGVYSNGSLWSSAIAARPAGENIARPSWIGKCKCSCFVCVCCWIGHGFIAAIKVVRNGVCWRSTGNTIEGFV